jgi:ankyrin repeat protein
MIINISIDTDDIICPISNDIIYDPVVCTDGKTYERKWITRWIADNNSSPLTRQLMTVEDIHTNNVLNELFAKIHNQNIKQIVHYVHEMLIDINKTKNKLCNMHIKDQEYLSAIMSMLFNYEKYNYTNASKCIVDVCKNKEAIEYLLSCDIGLTNILNVIEYSLLHCTLDHILDAIKNINSSLINEIKIIISYMISHDLSNISHKAKLFMMNHMNTQINYSDDKLLLISKWTSKILIKDNNIVESDIKYVDDIKKCIIMYLIDNDKNININACGVYGFSCLHNLCNFFIKMNVDCRMSLIKYLIDNDADINVISSHHTYNMNVFDMICASFKYVTPNIMFDLIKLFINNGFNVKYKDVHGNTMLHMLCANKAFISTFESYEIINYIISHGCDPNILNNNGESCIHLLCTEETGIYKNNAYTYIVALCSKYYVINMKKLIDILHQPINDVVDDQIFLNRLRDEKKLLPIERLCMIRGVTCINKLTLFCHMLSKHDYSQKIINSCAIILCSRGDINTNVKIIHYLIDNEMIKKSLYIEMIVCLIHHRSKNNTKCDFDNKFSLIKYLMSKHNCVNEFYNKLSVLHYLCSSWNNIANSFTLLKYFIENGANVNAVVEEKGFSCLHLLCCKNMNILDDERFEMIKYLVENGCNINLVTHIKRLTCLHVLCGKIDRFNMSIESKIKTIKYLIDNGAQIDIVDSYGYTPLLLLCSDTSTNITGINKLNLMKYIFGNQRALKSYISCVSYANNHNCVHILCKYSTELSNDILLEMIKLFFDNGIDPYAVTKNKQTYLQLLVLNNQMNKTTKMNVAKYLINMSH